MPTCRPLLLVLNPRAIPECIASFAALTVEKAYLTGYTERQLVPVIADIVSATNHTHYVAISDDTIVTQRAVDAVYDQLPAHPVTTGWCNLDDTDPRCSVVGRELQGDQPNAASYDFLHWSKVALNPEPVMRTWFAGMCLTGMSKEMWQRFPFQVLGSEQGWASDYSLCTRLQAENVPITAVRDAGVLHVRQQWDIPDSDPRKRLLVGEIEPTVTFA